MESASKIVLRSEPSDFTNLSLRELGETIRKYNFFCKGYDWNKDFSNDTGASQNDFFDNLDGTVTDRATGLMWQKAHRPAYGRWKDAKEYISKLNAEGFCGYHDWRLPTIEECCSLFTMEQENDGLFISPLFTNRMWVWTCDVKDASQGLVWNANFVYGSVYWIDAVNGQDIRAVRTAADQAGRQFYRDHLSLLMKGDVERLLSEHYHVDAEIVTFRGVYKGHDRIREHFSALFPLINDTIVHVRLENFAESNGLVLYRNSITGKELGVVNAHESLYIKDGKILKHMIL